MERATEETAATLYLVPLHLLAAVAVVMVMAGQVEAP
jgi:hypothetical protein